MHTSTTQAFEAANIILAEYHYRVDLSDEAREYLPVEVSEQGENKQTRTFTARQIAGYDAEVLVIETTIHDIIKSHTTHTIYLTRHGQLIDLIGVATNSAAEFIREFIEY